MKTRTYIEKVSIPECTAIHHVWSFDGESPEIGSLCECGLSRWDENHLPCDITLSQKSPQ